MLHRAGFIVSEERGIPILVDLPLGPVLPELLKLFEKHVSPRV